MWRIPLKNAVLLRRSPVFVRDLATGRARPQPLVNMNHVPAAFQTEYKKISVLSKLINQSNPESLGALEDVHEMMFEYTNLVSQGAIAKSISLQVTRALLQTARDCNVLLRRLPKRSRDTITGKVYQHLREYASQISEDIIQKRLPRDLKTLGTLLALYETIDPQAGLVLFKELDAVEATGSAMPCMLKAGWTLDQIKEAYERAPTKTDWIQAHMVRAYFENGEPEAAMELYRHMDTHNSKIMNKLDDLIIAEGPVVEAQKVLAKTITAPRSFAIMRLLERLWDSEPDMTAQFKVFDRYLQLVLGTSEEPLVGPTRVLVQHIFKAHGQDVQAIEANLQKLARLYESRGGAHTFLLNVILTEMSRAIPTELDLATKIMVEYGAETDPVSYRVRLNALESVDFEEKPQLVLSLWEARMGLQAPLAALDWIALGRSDKFGSLFNPLWQAAGQPFYRDVMTFHRSYLRT